MKPTVLIASLLFLSILMVLSVTATCYTSVTTIPVNCTGTILHDTPNGACRTVTCANGLNNITAYACDKPDAGTKLYFEMYRQASTNSPPTLCLGATCMSSAGYLQSTHFPYCTSATNQTNTTTPTNTTNTTTPTNTTSTRVCVNSITGALATCQGGTITSDTNTGCRFVTCTSNNNYLTVEACNKGTDFELYNHASQLSTAQEFTICIAGVCINSNTGFKQSTNYPVCYNTTSPHNTLLTLNALYTGSIAKYGAWASNPTLTDDNLTSGGQNSEGTPQWVLDLGPNTLAINATDFGGQYQGRANAVTNWTVQYSANQQTWSTAVANWNPGTDPNDLLITTFPTVIGARYWRFTMNSNSCPNGCWIDDFGLGSAALGNNTRLTTNSSYTGTQALYGNWSPTHLTDGDAGNSGGQYPTGTPQWVIDLGPNNYVINTTDFGGHYQGLPNAVTNWTVEYSTDDATWTTAVANWNPGGPADTLINKTFAPVTGARYWRFTMNSNSCPNGCWVDEFGLWGTKYNYQRYTTNHSYSGSTALYGNWGTSAATLTDRNLTNGGQNPDITAPQWTIDLGASASNEIINTTDFSGQYQGTGNAVTNWSVDYSTDDSHWTSALASWNPGGTPLQLVNKTFTPVVGARYWRFTMGSNTCPNGCWVDDFGLWGTNAT